MNSLTHCGGPEPQVRKLCEQAPIFGSMEGPAPSAFVEKNDMVFSFLSLWLLVGNEDEVVSAEDFLAKLPPPEDLARLGLWRGADGTVMFHPCHQNAWSSLCWPALALEKLGAAEASLGYATKALEVDQTAGGGSPLYMRALAQRCCGRLLANMGRMDEARACFEEAEAMAATRGYWMCEALARRDLVEHVLEPSGVLGEGGRQEQLAPLVARLAGPRDALATLLGD